MRSADTSLMRNSSGSQNKTALAYICFGLLFFLTAFSVLFSVNHVTVEFDGKKAAYYTFAPTVASVLKELDIKEDFGLISDPSLLKEGESLTYYTLSDELNRKTEDGMKITIISHKIHKVAQVREIPTPVRREWDIYLDTGKQRIISPGQKGLIKDTIMVYYSNGKLASKTKVSSEVVKKAKPVVIAYGSYKVVSRQAPVRNGTARKFVATAYTHTGYRTATGARTRYGIVAVDPRVIPLGTKLYVEGYGYAVAADTGGAIKGNRIDVFLESEAAAKKWGRRSVTVRILR